MTCTELIFLLFGALAVLFVVGLLAYNTGHDKGMWEEAERHKQDKLRKEGWVVSDGMLLPPRPSPPPPPPRPPLPK